MATITVYAHPTAGTSKQTIDQLHSAGLRFNVVSARSAPESLTAARVTELPAVIAITSAGRVRWHGYRPDLIPLLADLIETGPVPAQGLSDADMASDAVLTRDQALQVIRHHQINPSAFLLEHGDAPLYRGATVLHWLGY